MLLKCARAGNDSQTTMWSGTACVNNTLDSNVQSVAGVCHCWRRRRSSQDAIWNSSNSSNSLHCRLPFRPVHPTRPRQQTRAIMKTTIPIMNSALKTVKILSPLILLHQTQRPPYPQRKPPRHQDGLIGDAALLMTKKLIQDVHKNAFVAPHVHRRLQNQDQSGLLLHCFSRLNHRQQNQRRSRNDRGRRSTLNG